MLVLRKSCNFLFVVNGSSFPVSSSLSLSDHLWLDKTVSRVGWAPPIHHNQWMEGLQHLRESVLERGSVLEFPSMSYEPHKKETQAARLSDAYFLQTPQLLMNYELLFPINSLQTFRQFWEKTNILQKSHESMPAFGVHHALDSSYDMCGKPRPWNTYLSWFHFVMVVILKNPLVAKS